MRVGIWFCLIASTCVGNLEADTLTYNVTPNAGRFEYQLVLTNTGATGGPLFDLLVGIPAAIGTIDTQAIGRPAGWGDAVGGLVFFGADTSPSTSFMEWAADFSGTYDVGIARSLSRLLLPGLHPDRNAASLLGERIAGFWDGGGGP